ncbi:MAG: hypothetical protein ACKVPX_18455 [Myxococcaceae bacterium]
MKSVFFALLMLVVPLSTARAFLFADGNDRPISSMPMSDSDRESMADASGEGEEEDVVHGLLPKHLRWVATGDAQCGHGDVLGPPQAPARDVHVPPPNPG